MSGRLVFVLVCMWVLVTLFNKPEVRSEDLHEGLWRHGQPSERVGVNEMGAVRVSKLQPDVQLWTGDTGRMLLCSGVGSWSG